MTEKRWYVLQVISNQEKSVEQEIRKRTEFHGVADRIDQLLVPTQKVMEIRSGQKRRSEQKFFPGYILVRMEMDDEVWHVIRRTPGVLGFVGGTSDRPAPISDREAETILDQVKEGADKPKPKVLFSVGEMVRVTEGPFADFDGVVEKVNYEKSRLQVAVLIFGRSTPVELEFSQVEKV